MVLRLTVASEWIPDEGQEVARMPAWRYNVQLFTGFKSPPSVLSLLIVANQ